MTTHERERLEELATAMTIKGHAEPDGERAGFAYRSCGKTLTSLLSEMGDGWISVEERLPEGYNTVVVYSEEYGVQVGNWAQWDLDDYRQWYVEGRKPNDVTHWQPLPGQPTQQSES